MGWVFVIRWGLLVCLCFVIIMFFAVGGVRPDDDGRTAKSRLLKLKSNYLNVTKDVESQDLKKWTLNVSKIHAKFEKDSLLGHYAWKIWGISMEQSILFKSFLGLKCFVVNEIS